MEKAFSFGPTNSLAGVLNEPANGTTDSSKPIVVILNAGLIHHAGPHRMSVEMARETASQGYTCFRFDLSSIGDSPTSKSRLSYQERAIHDIREALNFLSSLKNINKFVLIGLCTGADNAHRAAVVDDRIVGCIFLGGYAYPTRKFHLVKLQTKLGKLVKKMLSLDKWKRLVSRAFSLIKAKKKTVDNEVNTAYYWKMPGKEKTRNEYLDFVKRNVQMFFIFTASELTMFNYQNQIKDSFKSVDFKDLLTVTQFDQTDHTYSFAAHRKTLISTITDWLHEKY